MHLLRARRGERGFTLVELLSAMALLSILGGLLVLAVATTLRSETDGQDESAGLGDVRAVIEQLSRDIRDARAVTCDGAAWDPSCQSHLQLWIDFNSDYVIQPSTEIVTWQLQKASDQQHYEVIRTVGGVSHVVARSLIVQVAFSYDVAPTSVATSPTNEVTTFMTYDSIVGLGTSARNLTFTPRLRNVT
jgi:prepilin-type N-terminal cleavage/methylation domain-containing protein